MPEYDYDLYVIGGGSGGVRAARISAGYGARVGLCEEYRLGGTCVIRGCVPKKLLVFASHFSEELEDAAAYGWKVDGWRFSWPDMIGAKDKEIDRLNAVYLNLLNNAKVDLHEGRGRLLGSDTVQVGEHRIRAKRILIATGARPYVPEFPGSQHVITSDEAFHLEELPGKIVIVGGGYIACEFAGIFNGMGSEVTQVYRGDAVLRGFDNDVRHMMNDELQKKGINLLLETNIAEVSPAGGGFEVRTSKGETHFANIVMYSTGRVPYTRDLGLEAAGIEANNNGAIPVDEFSTTACDNIFAVGDVTNRLNLTPVAIHEGHAFADTIFGEKPRPCDHRYVPSAVFSQPAVGVVGLSEEEARELYAGIRVYKSTFSPMKHTLSGRNEKMMVKLVVDDATDQVVGCHIVGPDAAEIVQGFGVAVKARLTKSQFDATMGIHPTSAEELVTLRVAESD